MNLIEESYIEKQERPKKIRRAMLIGIIILIIAIFIIGVVLLALQEKPLTLVKDGQANAEILKILKIQEDGTIYVPIKRIAPYLGYDAYNGEYESPTEEQNKCYVITNEKDEVVNLSLEDKRIYVLNLASSNTEEDYIYYDMKEEVKAIDTELCIRAEEMEKVFNTRLIYNQEARKITIETLPYLIQYYNAQVLNFGYEKLDENFQNYKMIFKDMLIVSKASSSSSSSQKAIGVIDANSGNLIIDAKYNSIEYLPNIGDCIVSNSNNKYGVVSPTEKKTKIEVTYDEIKLIDKDAELYLVKKDNKYGVVNLKGQSIIPVEYDEIGVDLKDFERNNIKNKYLLVDNLIPIRKDKLWGMADKRGNLVVEPYYDSFGYKATTNKDILNLLVVPEHNLVVACKDKKYALINKSGQPLFAPVVDDIYMQYENGKYKYYMWYNDDKKEIEEYLKMIGIPSGTNSRNNNENANQTTTNQENNQQTQQQQNQEQQVQQGEEQQVQEQQQQQLTPEQEEYLRQQQMLMEQQQQQQMPEQQQMQ